MTTTKSKTSSNKMYILAGGAMIAALVGVTVELILKNYIAALWAAAAFVAHGCVFSQQTTIESLREGLDW